MYIGTCNLHASMCCFARIHRQHRRARIASPKHGKKTTTWAPEIAARRVIDVGYNTLGGVGAPGYGGQPLEPRGLGMRSSAWWVGDEMNA